MDIKFHQPVSHVVVYDPPPSLSAPSLILSDGRGRTACVTFRLSVADPGASLQVGLTAEKENDEG